MKKEARLTVLRRELAIEAPVRTPILAGAVITTAEAEVTCKPIIGVLAVDLKETHSDLPQLPDRMQEERNAQRTPAVPVPPVQAPIF